MQLDVNKSRQPRCVSCSVCSSAVGSTYNQLIFHGRRRKGLFIIDLETPYETPRFIPQGGTWEVADVQWNPHPARSNLICSTSSQKLLVWDLNMPGQNAIMRRLHAHYRAITDINWHSFTPDVLSSCGIGESSWWGRLSTA